MEAKEQNRFKSLVAAVNTQMYQELEKAWNENRIAEFLKSIHMDNLIPQEAAPYWEDTCREGKIIILGAGHLREHEIYAIFKSENIAKDRIEMYLEYDKLQKFNFNRLQYNSKYRLILVGPMPHSVKGKDDFSSGIAMMEQTDGYTKVRRLCSNGELKITKTNLRRVIHEEVENGYLAA